MKFDVWDKNILILLQCDNCFFQWEIVEQVNFLFLVVNCCIVVLEEVGIIKGNVSFIDVGKVGCLVMIVVQVVIENE